MILRVRANEILVNNMMHFILEAKLVGLKIFKKYSREACILECSIKEATKRCGCSPWNYPHILEASKTIKETLNTKTFCPFNEMYPFLSII